MKAILILVISFLCTQILCGQHRDGNIQKNYLFVQLNPHLEKRGTDENQTSNPDFALAYERDITGIGDHRF
ncbi:MAG: hypothetical protein GY790_07770 [Bacteroidetes bacterium]|nr:hypothetical protein [Bacteroidota bacterium]